jgi:hypothetical protein
VKFLFSILLFGLILVQSGCEKETIDPDAAKLMVDFTWEGLKRCGWGNPEIHIDGVPDLAKFLKISMYDHAYSHDHGTVIMPYAGEKTIPLNRFPKIQGPCPVYSPGRYEITIKALDVNKTVVGVGSRERPFPEGN